MKIDKTTLRNLIRETIEDMSAELEEASELKKFVVSYKTKRGKDSKITVKARDKEEAMQRARARLMGKMYDLYYAKQVDEAVDEGTKFTVVHKTNRGRRSSSLTNTFDSREKAVAFAADRRKQGMQATVYQGTGSSKKQIDEAEADPFAQLPAAARKRAHALMKLPDARLRKIYQLKKRGPGHPSGTPPEMIVMDILRAEGVIKEARTGGDWGVEWTEFNKSSQLVGKQKFFATEKARDKFISKLEDKDNFNQVTATSDPRVQEMTATGDVAGYNAPMGMKLTDLIDDEDE